MRLPVRATLRATALTVVLCSSACQGEEQPAPPGIFFPVVPRQDAYPAALMTGVLEVRSGCVFVAAGEERWLLLWPEDYTARIAHDRIEVLDGDGVLVGTDGQEVTLGGGESRPTEVGGAIEAERWAKELAGVDIPDRCGDLYWLVAP